MDAAGDVFFAYPDSPYNGVVEVPNGCTNSACWIALSGAGGYLGLAVDAVGDVFNNGPSVIGELHRSQPPSFSFGPIEYGTTSTPQTFTVQNIGNVALDFQNIAASANFTVDSGTTTCSTSSQLAFGAPPCTIGVACAPHAIGSL